MKPSEPARQGWQIVASAIRLLGMRGDINRGEVRRFVPILRRHAMRIDPEAYRSLRMGPRADLLTAPAELAALVRRSRGFQKEFDAAEARRFKQHDLPALEQFRARVLALVADARRCSDPDALKAMLGRLVELRGWIPENHPTQGIRWGREGAETLDAAIRKVEALVAIAHPAARLAAVAEDVAQIRAHHAAAAKRAFARARKMSGKGGRKPNNPNLDRYAVMRAMHARVKGGLGRGAAARAVIRDYGARGQPIDSKPDTLCKQYRTWLTRRTD